MKSPIQITKIDNGWIVGWQVLPEVSNIHPAAQEQRQAPVNNNAVYCVDHDAICKCLQDAMSD